MTSRPEPEPDQEMLRSLQRTLLLHGLDFARSGVARLDDDDDGAGRYAVVHLALGIEILLKARLLTKDWRGVFGNRKRAGLSELRSGAFLSVTAEDCIDRLVETGVEVGAEQQTWLEELRLTRNKVVHFPVAIEPTALKPQALRTVGFILDFIQPIVGTTDEEVRAAADLREQLLDLASFREQRWSEIRASLTQSPLVECSLCHEIAGYADDGYHCAFCRVRKDGETAVNDHVSEVLDLNAYDTATRGGEWPRYECDSCLEDTMAPVDSTDKIRLCFSCGNSEDTDGYRDFDDEND